MIIRVNKLIDVMSRNLLWERNRGQIAQFMVDRMFSKKCLQLQKNNLLKIEFINVIGPIHIDQVPSNLWDNILIQLDDCQIPCEETPPDQVAAWLIWEKKEFRISNPESLKGITFPVGAHIFLFVQVPSKLVQKKGKTVHFSFTLRLDKNTETVHVEIDRQLN